MNKVIQEEVIARVLNERAQQDARWGVNDHHDPYWLAIAIEELGEAAQLLVKFPDMGRMSRINLAIDHELVHCAAVLVAWLECRERRRGTGGQEGEEAAL